MWINVWKNSVAVQMNDVKEVNQVDWWVEQYNAVSARDVARSQFVRYLSKSPWISPPLPAFFTIGAGNPEFINDGVK